MKRCSDKTLAPDNNANNQMSKNLSLDLPLDESKNQFQQGVHGGIHSVPGQLAYTALAGLGNKRWAADHSQNVEDGDYPEEFLISSDHIHCTATLANTNRNADAAVLIENIQKVQPTAIHCLIKWRIKRTDVVRKLRSQQR